MGDDMPPEMVEVVESAARLQQLVPDLVLVGGAAAALHAHHRASFDHDHVLVDLRDRFDLVLEALESEGEWVTNRTTYGKIILGELGDIEAGVRQLIRRTPLEVQQVRLPSGNTVTVPTIDETLRIKAFLVIRRNQTRDYLDVAALSNAIGIERSARVLADLDRYYADQHAGGDGVVSQVQAQLADPRPRDSQATRQLTSYKRLTPQWQSWGDVRAQCQRLAAALLDVEPGER